MSNCQELCFLEDTVTSILHTDASDYGIGGYLYMIVNHQLRVIRFFSKCLVGSQLNWSARDVASQLVKLLVMIVIVNLYYN